MIGKALEMVANEVAKKAEEAFIEAAKTEAGELPDKIGELAEVETLPDKIDLLPEDILQGELLTNEIQHLPENLSPRVEPSAPADTVDIPKSKNGEEITECPKREINGGSYKDVKIDGEGELYEVHHMPSDSASYLERGDGPAIKMEKDDHRKTASCGMSREAREYREKQKSLIEQGKFDEALQMDIDDIHEKFGDKYDDAINEMLEYVDQLKTEGKIQ